VRKQAEHALRESDRMKTEFISTAAHELRTPLTSILGFSQVLLSPETVSAAEQKEFIAYIHQRARALSDMVADLLDISRIESGQGLALRRELCTAGELVIQLAPFIQSGLEASRFELAITSESAPLLVDMGKMVEVFENLLSNAVKYSPPGSPIRIAGEIAGENYRFSVADRGIGMTPEQAARVFDKFYRADASDTAVGGLGLGMSIVRNILEAHGGSIWVESEPGRGTTVQFHLPLGGPELSGNGNENEDNPHR
jgi:signal transduction histidine kinase